jgi:cytidylate kinase
VRLALARKAGEVEKGQVEAIEAVSGVPGKQHQAYQKEVLGGSPPTWQNLSLTSLVDDLFRCTRTPARKKAPFLSAQSLTSCLDLLFGGLCRVPGQLRARLDEGEAFTIDSSKAKGVFFTQVEVAEECSVHLVVVQRTIMAIITISRGSYSRGKEIAENVARSLGYECIAREALLEASEQFHTPDMKLVRAIHDAPSILDRFRYGKERYVAYIRAALARHVQKDNVVYHGLAGHFLLKGVSHVLKVRIIADLDNRVMLEMEREHISRKEALRILKKDDEQRRKWSQHLYGIDTRDPSLYDLVLHIRKITVDDAVDIICHTARREHFRTTPQSQKAMDDLLLACEVKACLMDLKPDIKVSADTDTGIVLVKTQAPLLQEEHLIHEMKRIAETVPGVKAVHVNVRPTTLYTSGSPLD